MLTTNDKIEMIKLIVSYFVIVSPPPIVGRDEPNSRWWLFYGFIKTQIFAICWYFKGIIYSTIDMYFVYDRDYTNTFLHFRV